MLSFLRPSGPRAPRIPAIDAVKQSAAGALTLLDVRDAGEIAATGRARGALHVPLREMCAKCDPDNPACVTSLSLSNPVALYCASGARSAAAASQPIQTGYETIYNLGSLRDWPSGGGAVER